MWNSNSRSKMTRNRLQRFTVFRRLKNISGRAPEIFFNLLNTYLLTFFLFECLSHYPEKFSPNFGKTSLATEKFSHNLGKTSLACYWLRRRLKNISGRNIF